MATDEIVREVLRQHVAQLMQLANVVGVGIRSLDEADPDGDAVLAVYVKEKVPADQLAAADVVPPALTATVGGRPVEVPTRVIEAGEIRRQ